MRHTTKILAAALAASMAAGCGHGGGGAAPGAGASSGSSSGASSGASTGSPGGSRPAGPSSGTMGTGPSTGTRTPPMAVYFGTAIEVALDARDLAADPSLGGAIYASTPKGVATLDAVKGDVTGMIDVGGEAGRLALSSDGAVLYAALPGAGLVARIDAPKGALAEVIDLGKGPSGRLDATDMAVSPASADLLLVALADVKMGHQGVALFDGAKAVQIGAATPPSEGGDTIGFFAGGKGAFGHDSTSGAPPFYTLAVDSLGGVTIAGATRGLLPSGALEVAATDASVFTSSGAVIDPEKRKVKMQIAAPKDATAVYVDEAGGRTYFASRAEITAFDSLSGDPIGATPLSGVNDSPSRLQRATKSALAFRTPAGQVFIVDTGLVQ